MIINKEFETIELEHNLAWDDGALPGGHMNFNGVPFILEKSEDGALLGLLVEPTECNELQSRDIYVGIRNVSEIYFLINAAFGLRVNQKTKDEWEGRNIGAILLTSDAGEIIEQPLVLGENIRDWFPGNFPNSVFKLSDQDATGAWSSPKTGASIDMLKIKLPYNLNLARVSIQARLESVTPIEPACLSELRAELVENVLPDKGKTKGKTEYEAELIREEIETSYPRIQIFGITCRTGKPGSHVGIGIGIGCDSPTIKFDLGEAEPLKLWGPSENE